VSQGEAPEEALTIRADAIPPEDQGHVVFA
jgi:hypothetical protein